MNNQPFNTFPTIPLAEPLTPTILQGTSLYESMCKLVTFTNTLVTNVNDMVSQVNDLSAQYTQLKNQTDSKLDKSGGSLSGVLDMNENPIQRVGDLDCEQISTNHLTVQNALIMNAPIGNSYATNKTYVDSQIIVVDTKADTAQNTAESAQSMANTAQNTADTAVIMADSASANANIALTNADTAQQTANDAYSAIEEVNNKATNAQTTANGALPKTGGNMQGDINMQNYNINSGGTIFATDITAGQNIDTDNLTCIKGTITETPVNDNDIVNKKYADENGGGNGLPLTGGTMTGDIDMGHNDVNNVQSISAITINGNCTGSECGFIGGTIDREPENDTDIANKKYVDTAVSMIKIPSYEYDEDIMSQEITNTELIAFLQANGNKPCVSYKNSYLDGGGTRLLLNNGNPTEPSFTTYNGSFKLFYCYSDFKWMCNAN